MCVCLIIPLRVYLFIILQGKGTNSPSMYTPVIHSQLAFLTPLPPSVLSPNHVHVSIHNTPRYLFIILQGKGRNSPSMYTPVTHSQLAFLTPLPPSVLSPNHVHVSIHNTPRYLFIILQGKGTNSPSMYTPVTHSQLAFLTPLPPSASHLTMYMSHYPIKSIPIHNTPRKRQKLTQHVHTYSLPS